MRTQLLPFVGLLTLVGSGGCSNVDAGHPNDPSGPPELVHVLIQDAIFNAPNVYTAVIDLFETTAITPACSDANPCINNFSLAYSLPVQCSAANTMSGYDPTLKGVCNDPLVVPSTGIPIFPVLSPPTPPFNADAGSGLQIRLVFNKLLNEKAEVITLVPGAPGMTETYALKDGVIELVTADDMQEWPGALPASTAGNLKYYDNTGNPSLTSDLIVAPLGPAIVLKPNTPLAPNTNYAIVFNPTGLEDRQGNAPADAKGVALKNPSVYPFHTEDLKTTATFPADLTATDNKILPNDILQFTFQAPIDVTTKVISLTGPSGAAVTTVFAYVDNGSDVKSCTANPLKLNLVNSSAPGVPADWLPGAYTLSLSIESLQLHHSTYTVQTTFTVDGKSDPKDANAYQLHPLPTPPAGTTPSDFNCCAMGDTRTVCM
jgi:hypothetical protein